MSRASVIPIFLLLLNAGSLYAWPATYQQEQEQEKQQEEKKEEEPKTEEELQKEQQKEAEKERQEQEISDFEDIDVTKPEEKVEEEPVDELRDDVLDFYGSARLVGGTNTDIWAVRDNASRFGLYAARDFKPRYGLFARAELGVNLIEAFDRVLNPKAAGSAGAGGVILRLGYVGVDTPFGHMALGKQWSTYYAVASFTDLFAFSGGLAAGTYAASTDGGAAGTGRADAALKYTLDTGPTDLRAQFQLGGRTIPNSSDATYGRGGGVSITQDIGSRLKVGAAFNYSEIGEITEEEAERLEIDGAARALIIGATYKEEPFVFSFTYAEHRNHDTNDLNTFIDARAFELYGRFTFKKRYRVVAGMNYLEQQRPDATPYNIRVGLFDFVYAISDSTFRSVVFFEFLLDKSLRSTGVPYNNTYVVGFRYAFQI